MSAVPGVSKLTSQARSAAPSSVAAGLFSKTEALQAKRENGQRKATVRDFHSFRVSWITLALAAGVPLELVHRVTGHRTVEVVMKHYFRPGWEAS